MHFSAFNFISCQINSICWWIILIHCQKTIVAIFLSPSFSTLRTPITTGRFHLSFVWHEFNMMSLETSISQYLKIQCIFRSSSDYAPFSRISNVKEKKTETIGFCVMGVWHRQTTHETINQLTDQTKKNFNWIEQFKKNFHPSLNDDWVLNSHWLFLSQFSNMHCQGKIPNWNRRMDFLFVFS